MIHLHDASINHTTILDQSDTMGFSMVFLGMRCIPGLHPLPDPYFCQAPDGSCLAGAMGHHNLTGSLEGSENPWKSNVFSSFFPLKQAWHVEKSPFCSALRLPLHGATLQSLGARSKSVVRGPRVLPELRHNRGGPWSCWICCFWNVLDFIPAGFSK